MTASRESADLQGPGGRASVNGVVTQPPSMERHYLSCKLEVLGCGTPFKLTHVQPLRHSETFKANLHKWKLLLN